MQSIPKGQASQSKHQERVSNPKTVSVIPKISEPNNLLPSILQLSKPVSHLFTAGFNDLQTQSSSGHKLYQPNYNEDKQIQNSCVFQLTKRIQENSPQRRKVKNQLKYENLKLFFLSQTQNIVFLSRSICSILNKQLIQKKWLDLDQASNKVSLYKEGITKLVNILLEHERFPFLCPQLNQKIQLKSSFQNLILQQDNQDGLIFNDNFQSSNILMVKQFKNTNIEQEIYCICTRFDYQTASYGQWFYFSVKRSKSQLDNKLSSVDSDTRKRFRLAICNMTKQYSLFGVSMKISVCRNGIWGKQGQNIRYYQTYFHRSNNSLNEGILLTNQRLNHHFYYALQFDIYLSQGEQILVSYNEPYTVSRLSNLVDNFQRIYYEMERIQKMKSQFTDVTTGNSDNYQQNSIQKESTKKQLIYYKRQIVSQTPLNNQISCLTFSIRKSVKKNLFKEQQFIHHQSQNPNKKIIFIMARAHPIQTAGSFVVQGIIKHLFLFTEYKNNQKRRIQLREYFQSQCKDKLLQNLLKNFIIKIIPMINPDGVIVGNSRCNLNGFDLNRQWRGSNKTSSEQISSLKRYLLRFKDRIEMVIDLHGHSKERNVFAYGMHDFRDPYVTRQFPFILSKLVSNNFSFNQCRFTRVKNLTKMKQLNEKVSYQANSKQGTARIWLFRKLSIPNIFTIQNSYCSSSNSPFHYDSFSYGDIGRQILFSISMYYINFSLNKNKIIQQHTKNKYFLQDLFSKQSSTNTIHFDELVKLKNSLIYQLKLNQHNVSVGLDDINSSESEEEIRINDQFKPIIRVNSKQTEKVKVESPSKSSKANSQRSLNKVLESSQKLNKIKLAISKNQNLSKLNNEKEQFYNFRLQTSQRIQTNEQSSSPDLHRSKLNINRRYSRNNLLSQTKSKINIIRYHHKKSVSNNKSTTEFQKNAQLSVVEVGWDQSKIIEGKNCQTERILTGQNDLANFPQIRSDANAIFIHRSNLTMKYKQLNKNFMSNQTERHPHSVTVTDKTNPSQESPHSIQLKKNVNQFIKKLESNRKLQNEMIMTRKIQKYKQIIMKINGKNN